MRGHLVVFLALAACTAEAESSATARIGEDITLVLEGSEAVAFTGFVLEEGAARPLYYGMMVPGSRGADSDHAPPEGAPLRLRFRPAGADKSVQLGDTKIVGGSLITTIGKQEGVETALDAAAAEYVYRGGKLHLTVEVVDGKVVLRNTLTVR